MRVAALSLAACTQQPSSSGMASATATAIRTAAKPTAASATARPSFGAPPPAEAFERVAEVTVKGSTALNCETKVANKWLRVRCHSANDSGGAPTAVTIESSSHPGDAKAVTTGSETALITPFVPGSRTVATFVWSDKSHTLVLSWPAGRKTIPRVVGAFKGASSPLGQRFRRKRPAAQPADSTVDACIYLGFSVANCMNAYSKMSDPIIRRYMRRVSDADAVLSAEQRKNGKSSLVASGALGPCVSTATCNEMNVASCLISAELTLDRKQAGRLHRKICACAPKAAGVPVTHGALACEDGKPTDRSRAMPLDEARQVADCAVCDRARGPFACAAEAARLRAPDTKLADYIDQVHVPRCTKP